MSASLKLGVMRPVCCADAIDTSASRTGVVRKKNRVKFTMRSPRPAKPALLRSIRPGGRLYRRRWLRRLLGRALARALAHHRLGLLRHLGYVQREILLLPASHDCDACLTGCSKSAEDFLSVGWIIPVSYTH